MSEATDGAPARDAAAEDDAIPSTHVVAMLRERLYGAISCLATLAVLTTYTGDDTSGWARLVDVAVAMGGLFLASLLADWVAHMSVHAEAPHGDDWWRMVQASSQILAASVLPMAALAIAGIGLLHTETAVWISKWVLVGELGVITLLAVRKTGLPWWQQTLTVLSLIGLGVLVIVVKMLAH